MVTIRAKLVGCALALSVTACAGMQKPTVRESPKVSAEPLPFSLQEKVEAAHAAGGVPALGAVVVRCGEVPYTAVSGVARLGSAEALASDARFNIGSNSKSLLATLAATFVQDGRLKWTTTVADVLGSSVQNLDPALGQATMQDLLAHRSGLPAYNTGRELNSVVVEGTTASEQRLSFARQVLQGKPAYERGSEVVYSNAGYVVAGVMLERLAGAPFEQLMRERVFAPLSMEASFGTPAAPSPGQPWGHFSKGGVHQAYSDAEPVIPPFLQPAGDVSLSLSAYGKYLHEHLCGLRKAPTKLLNSSTIQVLHAPQGPDGPGLGWGLSDISGVPASIHTGGTGIFTSHVAVLAGGNTAVATVTNSGAEASSKAARDLMRDLATASAAELPRQRQ